MTRTLLIPTDFSVGSLVLAQRALEKSDSEAPVNVLLVHGYSLSNGITDLLFLSSSRILESLNTSAFSEAIEILKNKYASKIDTFKTDLFFGGTQAAFNNYVEAKRVEKAYVADGYRVQSPSRSSFDVTPYILKSKIDTTSIVVGKVSPELEQGHIAELFYHTAHTA